MYLVRVEVMTPGGIPTTLEKLHEVLRRSAADTDQLQHAYLTVEEESTIFSLYLLALDDHDAVRLAEQLCRRTMAAVAPDGRWEMRSPFVGP